VSVARDLTPDVPATAGRSDRPRRYTRYVVRDIDGEIVQEGRIYGLRRALDLELVGKGKSRIRLEDGPIGMILGPYVFHPEVEGGPFLRIEVF
jgi:hypothetical protein